MDKKTVKRISEILSPTEEQKERIFCNILEKSKNENIEKRGFTPVKRLRPALLTAVVVVCLLATTAFAAVYLGLDAKFLSFLNPSSNEQAEYLASGAYTIDKQVTNQNGALDIKQVIGDNNLTYILMDFTAPEGTVLNASRYRFDPQISDITISDWHSACSWGFKIIDDDDPNDNKISLVMTIQSELSTIGKSISIQLKDLCEADPLPAEFKTVVEGEWNVPEFNLEFKDCSVTYPIDKNVKMYGYDASLKSISVSPISITLNIESGAIRNISSAAHVATVGTELDEYPVTINFKDGTSETTTVFDGFTSSDNSHYTLFTSKSFQKVINDKEIESIVFFDTVIPIN